MYQSPQIITKIVGCYLKIDPFFRENNWLSGKPTQFYVIELLPPG
jgi:hypothetical protein